MMTLTQAAEQNNFKRVRELIEAGANPNQPDEFGELPLRAACLNSHTRIIKYLLEYGADPNATDNNGTTVLHDVITFSFMLKKHIAKRLLKAGGNPNIICASRPMLHDIVCHIDTYKPADGCNQRMLPLLLKYGADPNIRGQVHGNETTLMMASYYAPISIMEQLIAAGADVNARDDNGENALFYIIAGSGPYSTVPKFECLYKHGIDLHVRTKKEGINILQWVIYPNEPATPVEKWLRAHGVTEDN